LPALDGEGGGLVSRRGEVERQMAPAIGGEGPEQWLAGREGDGQPGADRRAFGQFELTAPSVRITAARVDSQPELQVLLAGCSAVTGRAPLDGSQASIITGFGRHIQRAPRGESPL